MSPHLSLWTIYDHPRDFPNNYVARRFENDVPTDDMMVCSELEAIREEMRLRGLVRLTRADGDDPDILETWL